MKRLMKSCAMAMIAIVCGLTPCHSGEENPGSSPWLAHDGFEAWLKENAKDKPLYIAVAEGRLHDGVSEWRVRAAPAPENVEWYWYWWYDMDEKFYQARFDDLVKKQGFEQISVQSFVNEKGKKSYQSIFLKIIKKDDYSKYR